MSLNARTIGSLLNWMRRNLPEVMWRKGACLAVRMCVRLVRARVCMFAKLTLRGFGNSTSFNRLEPARGLTTV